MVDVAEDPAASVEISGIRFQSGTATYGAHLNLTRTAGAKPVMIHDCWFTHGGDIGRAIQVMNNRGLVYRCSFDGGLETGVPVLHHTGITLKWLGGEASQSWTTSDTMGSRDTTGLNNFYVEDCYFAGAQCFDFDHSLQVRISESPVVLTAARWAHRSEAVPDVQIPDRLPETEASGSRRVRRRRCRRALRSPTRSW